jgi:hypothetical protein
MMTSFDIGSLLLPSLVIFVVTAVATLRITRNSLLAAAMAAFKSGLFLIYYAVIFDGTFTFLDDWGYLRQGGLLVDQDIHWLNLLDNLDRVTEIAGGDHFLYSLYNATAIRWFGYGYFAPVALNIALTALVAWVGTRLALTEGVIPQRLAAPLFCFLLLHPDLTAWSTVMNGKDPIILLLHVVLLWSVSSYYRGRWLTALLTSAVATTALFFLRFYVPLLFSAALALVAALQGRGFARLRAVALATGLVVVAANWIGSEGLGAARESITQDLVNPAYGFLRFLLTPIPFNTDDAYRFLNLPMVAHWILLPFACLGLWKIVGMHTKFSRFFSADLAVFVGLYAIFAGLQEPRHRIQLDYAIALCQFLGIWHMVRLQRRQDDAQLENTSTSDPNESDSDADVMTTANS